MNITKITNMAKYYTIAFLLFTNSLISFSQDNNYSEWYLQRQDISIYVREEGTGKDTVVVVNAGFGSNHFYLLDAVSGLNDKFHFVHYDQRGSLLSPCEKENLTFQKNVDDLYALIKALRVKNVKLLCHAMGTLVGMELIKQHPDLVSNAVFVNGIIPKSDSMKSVFTQRVFKKVDSLQKRPEIVKLLTPYKENGYDRINSLEDLDSIQLTQKQITEAWRIGFASSNIYDVNKFNLLKGGRAFFKSDAYIMTESVTWNFDYRTVLSNLKSATFIQSQYDYLDFNAEIHREQLKDFPNIKLQLMKNAGHFAWIDDPAKFSSLLTESLSTPR